MIAQICYHLKLLVEVTTFFFFPPWAFTTSSYAIQLCIRFSTGFCWLLSWALLCWLQCFCLGCHYGSFPFLDCLFGLFAGAWSVELSGADAWLYCWAVADCFFCLWPALFCAVWLQSAVFLVLCLDFISLCLLLLLVWSAVFSCGFLGWLQRYVWQPYVPMWSLGSLGCLPCLSLLFLVLCYFRSSLCFVK